MANGYALPANFDSTMGNLVYRGYRSSTLHLILLVFLSGTALLIFGYISDQIWSTSVLSLVSAYVVKDSAGKFAEVYLTTKMKDVKTTVVSTQGSTISTVKE